MAKTLPKKVLLAAVTGAFVAISFNAAAQNNDTLTEEQLMRAFENAYQNFGTTSTAEPGTEQQKPDQQTPDATTQQTPRDQGPDVSIISRRAELFREDTPTTAYLPLEEVRIAIDIENLPLEEVVTRIISEAEEKTGPWNVKWRLGEENDYLMNERVNITAETDMGQFMSYLVDRVNNLTGVQLFVRVFDASRIILISDTY